MNNLNIAEGGSLKDFEKNIEPEMDKYIKHFEKELLKIRTGRAHTSMIEDIKVACYGSLMPLKEIAAISAPDVTLLVVQPWDKSIMSEIEKALANSDLGLTPQNDGNIIRIVLPKTSSSRREELAKVLNQKHEECKVGIRNTRRDINNIIRDVEKLKKLSEDYTKRLQDTLQKVTDRFVELSDKLNAKKEEEIRLL